MDIVFVLPDLAVGGAQRLVIEEAKYFSNRGKNVTLINTKQIEEKREFIESVDLPESVSIRDISESWWLPDSLPSIVSESISIRSELRDVEPDIVFSHYNDVRTYLALTSSTLDTPHVSHINGSPLWFENNPNILPHLRSKAVRDVIEPVPGHKNFQEINNVHSGWGNRIESEVYEFLRGRALQESDVVFTLTNQVKKELEKMYGIDPIVTRPGVSQEWIDEFDDEEGEDDKQRAEIMNKEKIILSVGRLDSRKRIDLLIKSFYILKQHRSDLGLVIGGMGEEEGNLKELATKLGVAEDVYFSGYIPEKELPIYYNSSDIFASPMWGAYGLVPLEAYAFDTKIVLAEDTFVKEVLADRPGVEISEPNPVSFSKKIDKLLELNVSKLDTSVVPTWKEYCDQKHEVLQEEVI